MIVGITGLHVDPDGRRSTIGAGKDTVANRLVQKHRFLRVGLADPLKRICSDIFQFNEEQLWGASSARNAPDLRYKRPDGHYLTPRYALQQLGDGWGRSCYAAIWIQYGIRVARWIQDGGDYDKSLGMLPAKGGAAAPCNVVFSDIRYFDEYAAVKEAGGKIVRVVRWAAEPFGNESAHESERQLTQYENDQFDYVLDNFGSIDQLNSWVDKMMEHWAGRALACSEAPRAPA